MKRSGRPSVRLWSVWLAEAQTALQAFDEWQESLEISKQKQFLVTVLQTAQETRIPLTEENPGAAIEWYHSSAGRDARRDMLVT